jgi:hypothetical protein
LHAAKWANLKVCLRARGRVSNDQRQGPLSMTAAAKRGGGVATTCAQTLIAPALSPKMVTREGSPPKLTTLDLTHAMAARWSAKPKLPAAPSGVGVGVERKPRAPRR